MILPLIPDLCYISVTSNANNFFYNLNTGYSHPGRISLTGNIHGAGAFVLKGHVTFALGWSLWGHIHTNYWENGTQGNVIGKEVKNEKTSGEKEASRKLREWWTQRVAVPWSYFSFCYCWAMFAQPSPDFHELSQDLYLKLPFHLS